MGILNRHYNCRNRHVCSNYGHHYGLQAKNVEIQSQMMREELELEKLKQQNFIIETEKMKLELEQMKLDYSAGKNDLLKLDERVGR